MPRTGRPTVLTAPAGTDDQGQPWTTGQRVVSRKRLGLTNIDIAADAGISTATLQNWRLAGTAARVKAASGEAITERETDYLTFLQNWESAEATHKATLLGQIRAAGSERAITRKTTVKQARERTVHEDGSVTFGELLEVERTEVTEERPGPWTALAWLLERRYPDEFGRRTAIELDDKREGASAESRASELANEISGYLAGVAEAAAVAEE